eukprot:8756781-Pyramimonas_sp.AAC.1
MRVAKRARMSGGWMDDYGKSYRSDGVAQKPGRDVFYLPYLTAHVYFWIGIPAPRLPVGRPR